MHPCGGVSLLGLILVLILVGVALWAVNAIVPMDPKIKAILNALVVIVVVVWLFEALGLIDVARVRIR